MQPTSFLVTGASGFLGYHLCRRLVDLGKPVTGLDIAPFDYPDLAERITFVQGDIRDLDTVQGATCGVDVVLHSAAALPLWPKSAVFSTNVDGTANVLKAARAAGADRVIFVSSTAVYGIPRSHPVDEGHPLEGVGPYGESKIQAEEVCAEYRRSGLYVPVLRPKSFAGPKRLGVFQIVCDWVKDGKNIPIPGKGNNKYQLLHVDDLVEAMLRVSTATAPVANDIFNVGATDFSTLRQDLQRLLDYAGFGKKVIPIPSHLVIPALRATERLGLSPLYEWIYETADKDHYVSTEKIERRLGWHPQKSTADVWIDTYRWYLEEIKQRPIETGTSHRVAWKQGILKAAKWFF